MSDAPVFSDDRQALQRSRQVSVLTHDEIIEKSRAGDAEPGSRPAAPSRPASRAPMRVMAFGLLAAAEIAAQKLASPGLASAPSRAPIDALELTKVAPSVAEIGAVAADRPGRYKVLSAWLEASGLDSDRSCRVYSARMPSAPIRSRAWRSREIRRRNLKDRHAYLSGRAPQATARVSRSLTGAVHSRQGHWLKSARTVVMYKKTNTRTAPPTGSKEPAVLRAVAVSTWLVSKATLLAMAPLALWAYFGDSRLALGLAGGAVAAHVLVLLAIPLLRAWIASTETHASA